MDTGFTCLEAVITQAVWTVLNVTTTGSEAGKQSRGCPVKDLGYSVACFVWPKIFSNSTNQIEDIVTHDYYIDLLKQDTGMEYTGKTRKLYPRNGANQGMTNLMDFKRRLVQVKINKSWTSNFQIAILVNFLPKIQSHSDFNL